MMLCLFIAANVSIQYSNNRNVFCCNNRNALFQYHPTLKAMVSTRSQTSDAYAKMYGPHQGLSTSLIYSMPLHKFAQFDNTYSQTYSYLYQNHHLFSFLACQHPSPQAIKAQLQQ